MRNYSWSLRGNLLHLVAIYGLGSACHSMLQRCGNVLLDTIFLRKYFDAKVSASKLDHTRVNTRLLNIHMTICVALSPRAPCLTKAVARRSLGPLLKSFVLLAMTWLVDGEGLK